MKKATVVVNHCNCHPETCCCNDWLVLDKRGTKVDTFYAKESADRVANTLNALDEDEEFQKLRKESTKL